MTTAVAEPRQQNTQLAPVGSRNTLKGLLDSMRQSIADVIPKHLTPERVMKMALVAASRQPKLFECTRESFLYAKSQMLWWWGEYGALLLSALAILLTSVCG